MLVRPIQIGPYAFPKSYRFIDVYSLFYLNKTMQVKNNKCEEIEGISWMNFNKEQLEAI